MISEQLVDLSRLQFAATAMYHFLFVPLTLGMVWLLVIMESVYVMTGKVVYRQVDRHDVRVTPYDCMAVVTGRGAFQVTVDGKDMTVDLRFTNVWQKRPGGWEMVAWEATRIPAKQ